MKLHAAARGSYNVITAYGDDYVAVNGERHQASVVVTPERVFSWPVASFDALIAKDFEALKAEKPEIVILGTGPRQRFPHPSITAPLTAAGIGVEVMDLKAACRTYNILVAEARKVALALVFR
ncbi:MAG: Mth938-like domain-containing protein [Betaproteobacteria bacterium]|nr:Mth938-like domain-containing protein [Betaproteobacteria bacterium]